MFIPAFRNLTQRGYLILTQRFFKKHKSFKDAKPVCNVYTIYPLFQEICFFFFFSFDILHCADISLCLCSTYSILRGAAINLITYSKVNQPTNTASAISKKYSSSRNKIMQNNVKSFTNLRKLTYYTIFVFLLKSWKSRKYKAQGRYDHKQARDNSNHLRRFFYIFFWRIFNRFFHLGGAGMMRILKQVPQMFLCLGAVAGAKILLWLFLL